MSQPVQLPDTFTPLFEAVKEQMGLLPALVYGRAWRFCQGNEGVCRASYRTMSEDLGVSISTIYRSLKKLVAAGFLLDLTPGMRNVPHRYVCTARASALASERREVFPTETVAQQSVPQGNKVFPTETVLPQSVSLGRMKRHIKRQEEETAAPQPASAAPANSAARPPEIRLFQRVCGFPPPLPLFADVIAAVRQIATRLGRPPTPRDVEPFLKAWLARGYNRHNLSWLLEWARSGEIPERKIGGKHVTQTVTGHRPRREISDEEFARLARFYNHIPDA